MIPGPSSPQPVAIPTELSRPISDALQAVKKTAPQTANPFGHVDRISKNELCGLRGYYSARSGKSLPTFRDNLSVPSSRSLEDGTDGMFETSLMIKNVHYIISQKSVGYFYMDEETLNHRNKGSYIWIGALVLHTAYKETREMRG